MLLRNNTNSIIIKRSFSKDKKIVKEFGCEHIDKNLNKIGSVIKHIPGHGAAT